MAKHRSTASGDNADRAAVGVSAVGIANETAVLRRRLEMAREETARLSRELTQARELMEKREKASVDEHQTLQQELDSFRQGLRDKERIIAVMVEQSRRLEDELQEQHLAYNGLRQNLEQKKLTLVEARELVDRLTANHKTLNERYQTLLSSARTVQEAAAQPVMPSSLRSWLALDGRFLMGLAASALLGVLVGAWSFKAPSPLVELPQRAGDGVALNDAVGSQKPAFEGPRVQGDRPQLDAQAQQVEPVVVQALRDRLRNNSFGPRMLVLKGGTFTMGNFGALPTDDDGPVRELRLGGFLIGATEVTFEEYDRFARATGRRLPRDFGWGRGRRPVVDVSWTDARAYADWLSRQTGQRYRLPSEAEWEYAAGADRRSHFWWGYDPERGKAVCFDCGSRWDNRSTAPVGTFDPNPFGLYDTAGNVMEWVEDCHHPSYVDAPTDGRPWIGETCEFRVARGGAFNKSARSMHTTARHRFSADTRIDMIGFRLARDE
ncbi:MAG: SUMF1/EgtB/PvdO family nonheme iron enzyme [Pseudomonadota bacterium]|nr:SUMF1/EgtB/PvdO family nonheme iron enzyme [Pseudomonadota bacterium]